MLQDFRRRTTPETGAARLAALRRAMAEAGVDAFLVPRADAHQGENVAPRDERLAWLTGFTGSAGLAVVTRDRAAIFVDGRYRLQVRGEVDLASFEPMRHPEDKPEDWLVAALPGGGRLGFDPWLHTAKEIETLDRGARPAADRARARREPRRPRLARPAAAAGPADRAASGRAGRAVVGREAGRARPRRWRRATSPAAVLTLPDSIAWLLNVRGSDIARTPVPLAFAILGADGRVALFTDPAKLDARARAHLGPEVTAAAPEAFGPALDALARPGGGRSRPRAPVWVADRLEAAGAEVVWERDPCVLPKAQKNAAELAGTRAAHLRDGAAVAELPRLARRRPRRRAG